jgi:N-acetylglucosamine kinase-like BadF-type ATPase
MNKELILGVDGGGSKTTVLLADNLGNVLGRGSGGSSNYLYIGEAAARHALLETIQSAFKAANLPPQEVAVICLGMAGVDRPSDRDVIESWVTEGKLAQESITTNDANLLLWAGTPEGWGIGVVSGTGSIVIGRHKDGQMARAGGWGYLIGDEGSGFAIGKAALGAISHAHDGIIPPTPLTDHILNHWGLDTPTDLIPHLHNADIGVEEIAGLAAIVGSAVREGDSVAQEILQRAGHDLGVALAAVHRRLDLLQEVPTALGGGVLANNIYLADALRNAALESGIRLSPTKIVREPARGAVRLAVNRLE